MDSEQRSTPTGQAGAAKPDFREHIFFTVQVLVIAQFLYPFQACAGDSRMPKAVDLTWINGLGGGVESQSLCGAQVCSPAASSY